MPPTLLKSQLSTLEEPNLGEINCVTVNTDNKSIAEITEEIINFVTVMWHITEEIIFVTVMWSKWTVVIEHFYTKFYIMN